MYKELVTKLRNCAEINSLSYYKSGLMKQAANAIEELCGLCASQSKDSFVAVAKYLELWEKQPRWISVNERLPGDYEKVLTCDDRGNIHMFEHCHSYKYPFNISPYHPRFYPVLFWMPLPEPPEEE